MAGGGAGGGRPSRLNYRPPRLVAVGIRLGAKLRPTRIHEETADLDLDPGAAAEVLTDVINELGYMVKGETEPGGTRATLRGVIGPGPGPGTPPSSTSCSSRGRRRQSAIVHRREGGRDPAHTARSPPRSAERYAAATAG